MRIEIERTPREDRVLEFAAGELSRYLGRMLPEAGELRLKLGVDARADGAARDDWRRVERYRVALTPEGGELRGNCARAVLLGAYEALRRLGCRFLAPGPENEIVPRIERAALELRFERAARCHHRGVCIEGADSRENVLNFLDWLPKLGLNAFFFQFRVPYSFYARWYEHRMNPTLPARSFTPEDARRLLEEAEAEARRRGLLLHKVGHGWTGAALGYEAVSWDRAEPLGAAARPLAALLDGRRELFRGVPLDTNLCLSNPDAVARFVELVAKYAREHPGDDYLHIWLADEPNNVCECEHCRATTPTDQYVALLNAIDARLTAEGLRAKLVFLLYQELLWPPIRERLAHPDRFALMFAPISRSFERSYEAADDGPLPPYVRNRIRLPVDLAENLRFLRRWQERFRGDSFVYDYPLGRAHYGDFGYLHIARVLFEDIDKLRELGLNGYMSCQELRAGTPNFLPNYAMGRALLDEDANFDEVVAEYFSALYGPNWREAEALLRALSECQVCDWFCGNAARRDPDTAAKLARAEALCAAFRTAEQGPAWERLRFHARYVSLLAPTLRAIAEGDAPQARERYERFRDFVRDMEPQTQPWLDVYRILSLLAGPGHHLLPT